MPQMAPISWLLLFFIFTISFIIFNMMNYYTPIMSMKKSINNKYMSIKSMNWKW